MNQESSASDEINEFVERQSPELKCSTRELVDIIRAELDGAEERVEAGMAVFSKNGLDVAGVKVDKNRFGLFVPQRNISNKFADSIGSVSVESDQIRFEKIENLNRAQLKKMIREQGQCGQ
jgi:uncharacterized protein YdhG (YjbR/CyaY superfamily)